MQRRGAKVSEIPGRGQSVARGVQPNKPMVPTAPTQPDDCSLSPLRRHIGRPLDIGAKAQVRVSTVFDGQITISDHGRRWDVA
jgi:hypothetical protein